MSRGMQDLKDLETVCKALAHATRRHIMVVLQARGGSMSAGDIAGRFACSWPTTTRHLRQLVDAGLIRVERQGREQMYSINRERLSTTVGKWMNYFQ